MRGQVLAHVECEAKSFGVHGGTMINVPHVVEVLRWLTLTVQVLILSISHNM